MARSMVPFWVAARIAGLRAVHTALAPPREGGLERVVHRGPSWHRTRSRPQDHSLTEAVVFGAFDISRLDRVDNIAIELHDDTAFGDAPGIFSAAIAERGVATSRSGELTRSWQSVEP